MAKMLSELISELSELLEMNGDAPVKVATQPNYPMAARVVNVYDSRQDSGGDPEWPYEGDPDADEEGAVWLAITEDREHPYRVPRVAWEG